MFKDIKTTDRRMNFNTDLIETLELQNMLQQAVQVCSRQIGKQNNQTGIERLLPITRTPSFLC